MAFAVLGFVLIGLVVGSVGRLVPPARSPLPLAFAVSVSLVGALVGGLVGRAIVGHAHAYLPFLTAAVVAVLLVAIPERDPRPTR